MQDISYPHVRQVIVNDRPISEKISKRYLHQIAAILPDVIIHGFGRFYDGTWYLILESKFFPYHVESWGTRGAIPASTLSNYRPAVINDLHKKGTV